MKKNQCNTKNNELNQQISHDYKSQNKNQSIKEKVISKKNKSLAKTSNNPNTNLNSEKGDKIVENKKKLEPLHDDTQIHNN